MCCKHADLLYYIYIEHLPWTIITTYTYNFRIYKYIEYINIKLGRIQGENEGI